MRGERIQLQQVIINLAINGFRLWRQSQTAARASIRTQTCDFDQILVMVEDVGVGVAPENAHRLFQRLLHY